VETIEGMIPNNILKTDFTFSGLAGEYFVAGELTRRGYIASMTLKNSKGIDILCSNVDAIKSVNIQVKTNKSSKRTWILRDKHESFNAKTLFYIFVNLNDNKKPPDYFVVPSKIVAEQIKKSHIEWLGAPGRDGRKHKDNTMRHFTDLKEKYLSRWDVLGL